MIAKIIDKNYVAYLDHIQSTTSYSNSQQYSKHRRDYPLVSTKYH